MLKYESEILCKTNIPSEKLCMWYGRYTASWHNILLQTITDIYTYIMVCNDVSFSSDENRHWPKFVPAFKNIVQCFGTMFTSSLPVSLHTVGFLCILRRIQGSSPFQKPIAFNLPLLWNGLNWPVRPIFAFYGTEQLFFFHPLSLSAWNHKQKPVNDI